jgi:hypothetical protein
LLVILSCFSAGQEAVLGLQDISQCGSMLTVV